ncbi:hypothetical protein [Dyella japonica]|uniref:Uncharacterized protein n=1 Tax=Dyella japonica TaxID=231455 RepID=A0ABV2K1V0_9GAMM
MTDETKVDGMTLETMLHRVTWIKDVTCDKTQPVTEFDRNRIHLFATELHAHLAAQSAMRVDEEDWRIGHFERARDLARELGFSGITGALTELAALLSKGKPQP